MLWQTRRRVKAAVQRAGAAGGGAAGSGPGSLRWLDLGGLGRLSDKGLAAVTAAGRTVTSLDIRGCSRLSSSGLLTALGPTLPEPTGGWAEGTGPPARLELSELVATSCPACTEVVQGQLEVMHPGVSIKR